MVFEEAIYFSIVSREREREGGREKVIRLLIKAAIDRRNLIDDPMDQKFYDG